MSNTCTQQAVRFVLDINISTNIMSDFLIDNKHVYNAEITVVKLFSYTSKIVLVLFLIGFLQERPAYIIELNHILKILIAMFLIYRFNSYRKHPVVFTELDRKVTYSAGMYILVISFVDIITYYTHEVRSKITPHTLPIIDYFKKQAIKIQSYVNVH